MDFKEYQEQAKKTAIYPDFREMIVGRVSEIDAYTANPKATREIHDKVDQICINPYYPALGLAGEVGEFCNKLKKVMRDNKGEITDEFLDFAKGEIGDILWYVAAVCSELSLDMNQIATDNINKLSSRKERGVLKGSGDNR